MMGVSGFIVSMLLVRHRACSRACSGWIGGALTFGLFAIFRAIYGGLGCATPSATQAYLASKTRRSGRVAALSALSSSFGLGTIIGPAVAPLFVLPLVGLAGPAVRLRRDRARGRRRRSSCGCPTTAPAGRSGTARR